MAIPMPQQYHPSMDQPQITSPQRSSPDHSLPIYGQMTPPTHDIQPYIAPERRDPYDYEQQEQDFMAMKRVER